MALIKRKGSRASRLYLLAILFLPGIGAAFPSQLTRISGVGLRPIAAAPNVSAPPAPGVANPGPPDVVLLGRRAPKHPKLSTVLAELSRAVPQKRGPIPAGQRIAAPPGFSVDALPKVVQDAVKTKQMRINQNGEVQVYILISKVTQENVQQLQAAGATIELHDDKQGIVQARVPVTRLEEVAALAFVRFVRLPDYGVPHTGSVNTQGDAVLKTDQVRSLLGVSGKGVRVGVISNGIGGIFATGCTSCGPASSSPINTGDLPNATGTRDTSGTLVSVSGGITAKSSRADGNLEGGLGGAPSGAEGTAMLEIVHDLAPDAQLLFANFETSLEFNQAVNFLAGNADVVVDDIGFYSMPYDGTSNVSTNTAGALNTDANPIRAYFTAVGNDARSHYREDFTDSGVDPDGNGDLHLFQSTPRTSDVLGLGPRLSDHIHLRTGEKVRIFLTWNDPFGASSNDYDLFLVRLSNGVTEASGVNPQTGTQDPAERIVFVNSGSEDDFGIVIQNFLNSAQVRNLDVFVLDAPPLPGAPNAENHNYNTVSSSVSAQGDADGSPVSVISVGAANWQTPDTIERFSSNGPTIDGRMKPDVTAVDGVSVTGAGGFASPFFGTSAAAPHGAGVAALLLQSAPCLVAGSSGARAPVDGRTILRGLLTGTVIDLGAIGPDNVFGFGRLDALAAASLTMPKANAGPNQTLNGTGPSGVTVTLNGSGSSDPNACLLTFSWAGGCGSASGSNPSVTCPLGVTAMTLTVTNNGVTLSAPGTVQITVTDFGLSSSPSSVTVGAGQSATYMLTVSSQFGPFTSPVLLSCSGLPSLSSCSFSPATATPGPTSVTSTLSIATAAPVFGMTTPKIDPRSAIRWLILLCALSLLILAAAKRRRLGYALVLVVLLVFVLQVACGGGGGGGRRLISPGTPSGTFPITVAGVAGSLQHSTTVTLVVQ